MTNYLYRHYDEAGTLLYVGISLCALTRLTQHRETAEWFSSIRTVKIERLASREAAVLAERDAIAKEAPLYNLKRPEGARARPALQSELDLIARITHFKPMYSVREAADVLNLGQSVLRQYMADRELAYLDVPWRKGTKPRRLITGWQLIDFIEHLQAKNANS